jgi:hypothetical protein
VPGGLNPGDYGSPGTSLGGVTSPSGLGGVVPVPDADDIAYDNSGSGLTGDTVQEAIDEIVSGGGAGGFVTRIGGGNETIDDHGDTGATETIDPAAGNIHLLRLTDDCTITLTAPGHANGCALLVQLEQDGTGSREVTWPGSVEWPGGVAPTLSTAIDAVDFVTLLTVDNGATWYGSTSSGGSAIDYAEAGDLAAVGLTADAGVSTEIPRADHVHVIAEAAVEEAGRWELAVIPGSPPDPLYADDDYLYIWVPG